MKSELVRILLLQLTLYQIPMPANIFNYLLNQIPKEYVNNHPNIISQMALNSYEPGSYENFFTLI